MMNFVEFRPLLNGAGLSKKEVWLFYRSFYRTFFFIVVHQKKFESNLASEIKYQKSVFRQIAEKCSGPIKKLVLDILLDEANFEADNFGKNVAPLDKHRQLLEKRTGLYELFFEFSPSDKEWLEKTALRLERKRDRISKKNAWKYGSGIAVGIAASAVLLRQQTKKDEKK